MKRRVLVDIDASTDDVLCGGCRWVSAHPPDSGWPEFRCNLFMSDNRPTVLDEITEEGEPYRCKECVDSFEDEWWCPSRIHRVTDDDLQNRLTLDAVDVGVLVWSCRCGHVLEFEVVADISFRMRAKEKPPTREG